VFTLDENLLLKRFILNTQAATENALAKENWEDNDGGRFGNCFDGNWSYLALKV
jgi:hypothetical protein